MHIQDPDQKAWIQQPDRGRPLGHRLRPGGQGADPRATHRGRGLRGLLPRRYVATKRFGLEGGEITIPALEAIIEVAAKGGVGEIAIGMPHRGRLNTLVNVVKKPYTQVFSEFGGVGAKPDDVQGSGDVKYHLGTSTDIEIAGRKSICRCSPTRRISKPSIRWWSARCGRARTWPATPSAAAR